MSPLERKMVVMLFDAIGLMGCALVAFYLAVRLAPEDSEAVVGQLPSLWLAGGVLAVAALFNDCHSLESLEKRDRFLPRWFGAWLVACFIYFIVFLIFSRESRALQPAFIVPRLLPGLFLLLALPGAVLGRSLQDRLFPWTRVAVPTLLVGQPDSCKHFTEELALEGFKNWQFVGQLNPISGKVVGMKGPSRKAIRMRELEQFLDRNKVSEIILTEPSGLSPAALSGLVNCFEKGVEILSLEQAFEKTLGKIPVEHLGKGWLPTTFWSHVQVPIFYRVFKRAMDVCSSGILLVGTLPIMIVAAVLIKLTSPGPCIYRQHRVGLHGRRFVIRKFRTMNSQPLDAGQKWAGKNDPRITPVGKFLRKLRIDELPQLFNVIAGQMSLVGPRPEQPEIAAKLQKEIPFFRARGKVLPGITGWAQVKHRYANSVDDSRVKLEYDLYYIKNRSILLDLIILAKTVRIVLGFKGH